MANPNASAVRPPRCSFASAQDLMQHAASTRLRTLDFVLIERRFSQTVTEILQDIDGVTGLTAEQAQHLLPAPGATAMQVTRRCINAAGRVLDLARWLHPAETLHDTLRRQLRHGS